MSHLDEAERTERIAYLIALEIATILDDLKARQAFLIEVWGRHRDRGPFLDTIQSRYGTLGMSDLVLMEPDTINKVHSFYRELDEFRLYLRFTEDMPTALGDAYAWQLTRLQAFAELAVDALGGPPDAIEVEIADPAVSPQQSPDDRPLLGLGHLEKNELSGTKGTHATSATSATSETSES